MTRGASLAAFPRGILDCSESRSSSLMQRTGRKTGDAAFLAPPGVSELLRQAYDELFNSGEHIRSILPRRNERDAVARAI